MSELDDTSLQTSNISVSSSVYSIGYLGNMNEEEILEFMSTIKV